MNIRSSRATELRFIRPITHEVTKFRCIQVPSPPICDVHKQVASIMQNNQFDILIIAPPQEAPPPLYDTEGTKLVDTAELPGLGEIRSLDSVDINSNRGRDIFVELLRIETGHYCTGTAVVLLGFSEEVLTDSAFTFSDNTATRLLELANAIKSCFSVYEDTPSIVTVMPVDYEIPDSISSSANENNVLIVEGSLEGIAQYYKEELRLLYGDNGNKPIIANSMSQDQITR